MAEKIVETPLMKQYFSVKAKYPDALLLFRVGDFYETFGEDAVKTSAILGIVLTRRANGAASFVELAGFPHHSLDTYLPRLVRAGHRVAICDQLEDPKLTKKLVKRGVTELVTPGVTYNDKILENKENNFLAAVHLLPQHSGIAFLDVSTGEFFLAQGSNEYLDKLMQSLHPNEIIVQKNKRQDFCDLFGNRFYINTFEDWVFTHEFAEQLLLRHFGTTSLKGYGVEGYQSGIIAAGACMHYLSETQHDKLSHISRITRLDEDHHVWLDRFTIRNLELLSSPHEQGATLVSILDHTLTPMGSRLLKRFIALPLKDKQPIEERLDIVGHLLAHQDLRDIIAANLRFTGDLERLISRVAVGRITPREIRHLKRALDAVQPVKSACSAAQLPSLQKIGEQLNPCQFIAEKIGREIREDPPASLGKGNVIADGVDAELDELRALAWSGKDYLSAMQQREIERTGISSLKIGYNNVFGYYLEVTNAHKNKVPAEWHRKQTLVGSERYITDELKEYEEKILGAEEKMLAIEARLFADLVLAISDYIAPVQLNAGLLARLDVLHAFSLVSERNNYCRPSVNEGLVIDIRDGRHPVIEQQLPPGETYIANDVLLDNQQQQILIITGPNMSGKSAYLRQTALIVLMAQLGCYVPAASASIGLVDKIFTRVGASDNISSGESTFMVEMNETASILNNISNRSLVLLDEIGRGTSTYDGISIAWSIAEYLHNHPLARPKVLFATHYHELNEMAQNMERIRNYHVSVREVGNKVLFLRKIVPGGTEHSFGIHVARMAGMPASVISRAGEVLRWLEESHEANSEVRTQKSEVQGKRSDRERKMKAGRDEMQLSFIQLNDPLLEELRDMLINLDINTLTPVEALMKLNDIKKRLKG